MDSYNNYVICDLWIVKKVSLLSTKDITIQTQTHKKKFKILFLKVQIF